MPILDAIQASEKKAEQMRLEATEEVRLLIERTRTQSVAKAKELLEEAIFEQKKIEQATQSKIINLQKEITSTYENQDQNFVLAANQRKNLAIDYIIKKVFEL